MKSLQERFDEKYQIVEPGGCWLWTASLFQTGYGKIGRGSRTDDTKRVDGAHRVSWELHRGPIPSGIQVLHRCDVRCCVNPAHLFLGTQGDNIRDMMAKRRGPTGEAHGSAKLTDAQVIEIRALGGTMSQRKIGERFGVTQSNISAIVRKKTWNPEPEGMR